MQHRNPKPRLDQGPTSAEPQAILAEMLATWQAATADQISAWVHKRGKRLPKATLYRLLAKAVASSQLSFQEVDGRRFYHAPGNKTWVLRDGQLRSVALPADLQQELIRFAAEAASKDASFALIIKP